MFSPAPKFSEFTQWECASVGTFFGWLFLRPKFQSAPKVNVLVLAHFLLLISVPKISECAQGECANVCTLIYFCTSIIWGVPKMSECAQCECTQNVRVCPMWMCSNCQSAPKMSVGTMWIHTKYQSAPNVNVLMLVHCLGSYFCAQIFRVHPRWMC